MKYLKRLSEAHTTLAPNWNGFCRKYFEKRYGEKTDYRIDFNTENLSEIQKECTGIIEELSAQKWTNDEAKEEMILAAEGICVLAQLGAKLFDVVADNIVNPKEWIRKYKEKWLSKNKESEISKIEEMILYIDAI